VKNLTLSLDVMILFSTVKTVLRPGRLTRAVRIRDHALYPTPVTGVRGLNRQQFDWLARLHELQVVRPLSWPAVMGRAAGAAVHPTGSSTRTASPFTRPPISIRRVSRGSTSRSSSAASPARRAR
jgi:hypothetical protein